MVMVVVSPDHSPCTRVLLSRTQYTPCAHTGSWLSQYLLSCLLQKVDVQPKEKLDPCPQESNEDLTTPEIEFMDLHQDSEGTASSGARLQNCLY